MGTAIVRKGEDLGRAVAEIRRQAAITQDEMASKTGLSRSYLAQLEGGRTTPALEHLLRVIRRAGGTVTVTWPDQGG